MKFIERHLNLIGLLLLTGFAAAAGALYWDVPGRISRPVSAKEVIGQFTCPMHQQIVRDAPGQCPECEMRLVKSSSAPADEPLAAPKGCCESSAPAALPGNPTCPHLAALTNSSSCPAHVHP